MLAVAGHDPDEPQRGKAATFFVSTIPVYKAQCDQHGDIARRDWVHLSRMYKYLGAEHMTNWANHVSLSMNSRVAALLRVFLTREITQALGPTGINKITAHMIRQLSGTPHHLYLPWDGLRTPATDQTKN